MTVNPLHTLHLCPAKLRAALFRLLTNDVIQREPGNDGGIRGGFFDSWGMSSLKPSPLGADSPMCVTR
jgi:hypothetical protein